MVLSVVLSLDQVADDVVRYIEQSGGKPPILGTIAIERWALPEQVPSELRLTIEFRREAPPVTADVGAGTSERQRATKASLSTGDKVKIVKNTTAGTKYPPEWLAQYLGRTGVVLWTTNEGAMVQLAGGATWFPYAELSIEG
jgi:hypothetical protein